jgi:cytochrome c556
MLSKSLLAIALLAVALPVAAQAPGPIEQRKAMMKQNGKDAKAGGDMAKGAVPFDAGKAKMVFSGMHDVAMKYGTLFPANSKTGGETEAAPAIWTKPAEFQAAVSKFQKDTMAALAANPQTLEAFRVQFGAVTANCKSCHETFRIKKD